MVYRDRFVRGPFHLGAFSYPVAIAAVAWIGFISIAFILPSENPVNSQTLNYAIVAVGIVLAYSMGFWAISARKWFTGPVKQIAGTSESAQRCFVWETALTDALLAEEMGIDVMAAAPTGELEKMERERKRSM